MFLVVCSSMGSIDLVVYIRRIISGTSQELLHSNAQFRPRFESPLPSLLRCVSPQEDVAELQRSLAELAKSQADMDKIRSEEAAAYKTNSADMEQGLEGVKLALKVLRDYYAKDAGRCCWRLAWKSELRMALVHVAGYLPTSLACLPACLLSFIPSLFTSFFLCADGHKQHRVYTPALASYVEHTLMT